MASSTAMGLCCAASAWKREWVMLQSLLSRVATTVALRGSPEKNAPSPTTVPGASTASRIRPVAPSCRCTVSVPDSTRYSVRSRTPRWIGTWPVRIEQGVR